MTYRTCTILKYILGIFQPIQNLQYSICPIFCILENSPKWFLPDPEERLAKAQLVQRISAVIRERELTQVQAGAILKIDQAKVSKLVRGRLSEFSTSTLIEYLTRLDQDVEIVVRPKPISKEKASLLVTIPEL